MKNAAIVLIGLIALLVPVSAHADPFGIEVVSRSYTTTIELGLRQGHTVTSTETTSGTDPVSLSLSYLDNLEDYNYADASVSADWLAVSMGSRTVNFPEVTTTAISQVTFTPHTAGVGTIGFDYLNSGPYTSGFVSLFDVFDNREVWRLTWTGPRGGKVTFGDAPGFDWSSAGNAALPTLLTTFNAAHTYTLNLTGHTNSQGDSTSASMKVTGLTRVPEPSTLFLLGSGLASVGIFRRRSRAQR